MIGSLYHALDNAINRKLLHMVDDVDTDIPFNPTQEAAWSPQFFIEKLQTIYSDYYSQLDTMSWPVFVWTLFIWLGTMSTAARILGFKVTCKPARGLAKLIVWCIKELIQMMIKPIKSSDWYQKKHIIPPRFHYDDGDNVGDPMHALVSRTQEPDEKISHQPCIPVEKADQVSRIFQITKVSSPSTNNPLDLGGKESSQVEYVIKLIDPDAVLIRNKVRRV
ncbi:hypothetical protein BpHYR1_010014 [Brachionus plicatilis]|uniref:Uncharacterized protein n=1 Tax=Brachionus plicatilis TaxID=10195 RepID=A0A3M7QEI5_BRAPC|nr:hypothetical protein BpHYR1_010014 [Brachionus plicatilis]